MTTSTKILGCDEHPAHVGTYKDMCMTCLLIARDAEVETLQLQITSHGRAQKLLDLDGAFYKLTVQERDFERVKVDRLLGVISAASEILTNDATPQNIERVLSTFRRIVK